MKHGDMVFLETTDQPWWVLREVGEKVEIVDSDGETMLVHEDELGAEPTGVMA